MFRQLAELARLTYRFKILRPQNNNPTGKRSDSCFGEILRPRPK
jgi:hypothetical protein